MNDLNHLMEGNLKKIKKQHLLCNPASNLAGSQGKTIQTENKYSIICIFFSREHHYFMTNAFSCWDLEAAGAAMLYLLQSLHIRDMGNKVPPTPLWLDNSY